MSEAPKPAWQRRLIKHQTRSSRAITAIVIAGLALIGAIYLLIEGIMAALGHEPLLASPTTLATNLTQVPKGAPLWVTWLVAGCCLLVGLALVFKGILPGHLDRHRLRFTRAVIVADDAVIAAGTSRQLRQAMGMNRGQVWTIIGKRLVTVEFTPTTGRPVDNAQAHKLATELIDSYDLTPPVRTLVQVKEQGTVPR